MSSGSTKLAEHRIPRMISGGTLMGVCVTEPSGGSDASAMKLHCRRDGDFYVLDGEKTSITFADCADTFIVFARTGFPESGAAGGYRWSFPRIHLASHAPASTTLATISSDAARSFSRTFACRKRTGSARRSRALRGLRFQPRPDRTSMRGLRPGFARRGVGVHEDALCAQRADRLLPGRHVSSSPRRQPIAAIRQNRASAATEKAPSRFGLRAGRRRLTETAGGVDGKLPFWAENDSLGGSCRRVKRELCGLGRPVGGAGSPGIDLRLPETDACRRRSGRKQRRVARFRRAHRRNNDPL